MRSLTNQWMRQLERDFNQSLKLASQGTRNAGPAGGSAAASLGMSFANLAFSLLGNNRTRTRTTTTTTGASETSRSSDENSFYRQSLSQMDAAASEAVAKGQRNL